MLQSRLESLNFDLFMAGLVRLWKLNNQLGDSKFIFPEKRMYREQQRWSVNLNVDGQSLMLNSH